MNARTARRIGVLWAMLFLTTSHATSPSGNPARGKALYESRCTACHSLDHSRIGPAHRGVFGRHSARASDFDYSNALKKANVVWTERSLNRWLTDPESFIPGQKMGYSVPDKQDRADIITFLASAEAR
jgi:cytochrome c